MTQDTLSTAAAIARELKANVSQVDAAIQLTIKAYKPKLEAIEAATAQAELASIDSNRGSWTDEDQ